MKKFILIMTVSMMSATVNAQFKIDENGRVGIKTTPSASYTVRAYSNSSSTMGTLFVSRIPSSAAADPNQPWSIGTFSRAQHNTYDLYSFGVRAQATTETNINYSGVGRCFGVFGQAYGATDGYNYGLYGCIGQRAGAAVYGTTNDYLGIALDQRYAGYFNGNVKIQGNLTVTGNVNGVVLGRSASSSDSRNMATAQKLTATIPVSSLLTNLDVSSFYHEQPVINRTPASSADTVDVEIPLTVMERQVLSKHHYGLDAEQLEEVFPDLVYENEDGSKSVNYVEMVPLLIQSIKELQNQIDAIKGNNSSANRVVNKTTGIGETIEDVDILSMGQNKPNPFSNVTEIEITIPEAVQHAFVYVYDLQGKKVQQVDVAIRGRQTVKLNAATLEEGMYIYSLIVDGKVVQTRRMIVEK